MGCRKCGRGGLPKIPPGPNLTPTWPEFDAHLARNRQNTLSAEWICGNKALGPGPRTHQYPRIHKKMGDQDNSLVTHAFFTDSGLEEVLLFTGGAGAAEGILQELAE